MEPKTEVVQEKEAEKFSAEVEEVAAMLSVSPVVCVPGATPHFGIHGFGDRWFEVLDLFKAIIKRLPSEKA